MEVRKELGDSQKYALELGIFFDEICRQYNIKYTLFGESLLGAVRWKSFVSQGNTLIFALPYKEYIKFLEKCEPHLEGTGYYIANSETHPRIDENVSLLVKRSRVTLSEKRKLDELYYDFSIKLMPLFYAGDDETAYKQYARQCQNYLNIIQSRKLVGDSANFISSITKRKDIKLASQDKKEAYRKLQEICVYHKNETKYVFGLDAEWKHSECIIKSETYNELTEVEIEGYKFLAIKNSEEWLKEYYGKDFVEQVQRKEINQMLLSGPEVARRIQLIELEMLIEVDRICRKHDIKYNLFAGTLLGAVRHGGFVPWDDDIDIVMLKPEYDRFLEVAAKELDGEKYFLRTQENDKDCNLVFAQLKRNNTLYYRAKRDKYDTHLGIFIDIIPVHNGTNSWLLHKLQHKLCRFTKTMVWAHMGAAGERRFGYRSYYNLLSKVSNKTSYKWYERFACMFKDDNSKRVSYLAAVRNPFNGVFAQRETYLDLIEVEFEGHMFFAPRRWHEYLSYIYSDEYMQLPQLEDRSAKHIAAHIELDGLYEFE